MLKREALSLRILRGEARNASRCASYLLLHHPTLLAIRFRLLHQTLRTRAIAFATTPALERAHRVPALKLSRSAFVQLQAVARFAATSTGRAECLSSIDCERIGLLLSN